MKTTGIKALFLAGVIGVGALAAANIDVRPQAKKRFPTERRDITKDLSAIAVSENQVQVLKAELKADRKADLKYETIVDRKELAKAKADLKRDKAYLKADKQDLRRDYRLAVKQQKDAVAEACYDKGTAKIQLRKDIRQENADAIVGDAAMLAALIREHEAEKLALSELKENRKTDFVAVNEEIRNKKKGEETSVAMNK